MSTLCIESTNLDLLIDLGSLMEDPVHRANYEQQVKDGYQPLRGNQFMILVSNSDRMNIKDLFRQACSKVYCTTRTDTALSQAKDFFNKNNLEWYLESGEANTFCLSVYHDDWNISVSDIDLMDAIHLAVATSYCNLQNITHPINTGVISMLAYAQEGRIQYV